MTNRSANNIRRIARTKELEDRLKELTEQIEKQGIAANRAISYIRNGLATGQVKTGDKDSKADELSADGVRRATTDEAAEATSDQSDFIMGARDFNEDTYTAEQVLDDWILKTGDKLQTLIVEDCATGNPIEIHLNNPIRQPEDFGIDGEPLPDPSWIEGQYWQTGVNNIWFQLSDHNRIAVPGTGLLISEATLAINSANLFGFSDWSFAGEHSSPPSSGFDIRWQWTSPSTGSIVAVQALQSNCPVSNIAAHYIPAGNPCDFTEAPPLPADRWDGTHPAQISYTGGQTKTSQYDPNVPQQFKGGTMSTIDFCYADGTKTGRLEPTKDGGFLLSKTDGAGGVVGNPQHFDSNNQLVGHVPPSVADSLKPIPAD
jgi:hypothetical protein